MLDVDECKMQLNQNDTSGTYFVSFYNNNILRLHGGPAQGCVSAVLEKKKLVVWLYYYYAFKEQCGPNVGR